MIKLTIGNGTPIETEKGEIEVEHNCVILRNHLGQIIIAYCLHPGESVRAVSKGVYDVQQ